MSLDEKSLQYAVGIIISVLLGALGHLYTKSIALEHRLTSLEVGHDKVEHHFEEHTGNPKLHFNIKEQLGTIDKQVQLNTQLIGQLGSELKEHKRHPRLHNNILVTTEVMSERIDNLERILNEK